MMQMNDDEKILIKHLKDLSQRSYSRNIYTYSRFLSMTEIDAVIRNSKEFLPLKPAFFGGSEAAERQIAVFGSEESMGYPPEYPVSVIKIVPLSEKYAENLEHRDYLGALMNLGIERELLGDIIIKGKAAWLYSIESITDFIIENLTKVRHTEVRCEQALGDIPELKQELNEMTVNVSSERIDSIVSSFTGISRGHIDELFRSGKVFVNGREVSSVSAKLKEGDVLTVRGYGRAIYDGISHETKKGRLCVSLRKYGA